MADIPKIPSQLVVIIRDDSPMIFEGDNPSYRRVEITLTPDQQSKIRLKYVGQQGESRLYEVISKCFLDEPLNDQELT